MYRKLAFILFFLFLMVSFGSGCHASLPKPSETGGDQGSRLNVVATTTIVGDVVHNLGGDLITLDVLLPVGMDPHNFQPTPQDMVKVADAQVVVMNGVGLERFMLPLLENAGSRAMIVDASRGISLISSADSEEHPEGDPHVWMDPNNVMTWVDNISAALIEADPDNENSYRANAEAYIESLKGLDAWIQDQVAQVPLENRKLVSDHQDLDYFARRYNFQQVGAIIPGFSTESEPSARDLAKLEEDIRLLGVKAIFIGKSFNPSLAQRISNDTHTRIASLFSGSLSEVGGEADNYLDYIRYNVKVIVEALK